MRRQDALNKIRRILGDHMGYRVDPKAPDADERAEALALTRELRPLVEAAEKARRARLEELLRNDETFQRLKAEHEALKERRELASSKLHHYRFTVGISGDLFFTVKAQGDSWEEVIEKLKQDRR